VRRSAIVLLLAACAGAGEPLRLERTIPLAGVKGRIDHLAVSADGDRLAVAALGNDTVEIVDLKEGRALRRLTGVGRPTGIVYAAGRLAVASGRDGRLHVFDERTLEETGTIAVGDDADNVRRDAERGVLWVGVADGALAAVERGAKAFAIPLAAHPESFQLEAKGPRIFVNVPDAGHVAVADRERREVVATWRLEGVRANFPMALDEAHGRLLVGCRAPARLLVLDTADGRVVASVAISGDVDDVFVDAPADRVYASCGEGFVDVIARRGNDRYERTARIPTARGARTCVFDAERRRLLVAAPRRGEEPAAIQVFAVAAPEAK